MEKRNRQRGKNRFPTFLKRNQKWHIGGRAKKSTPARWLLPSASCTERSGEISDMEGEHTVAGPGTEARPGKEGRGHLASILHEPGSGGHPPPSSWRQEATRRGPGRALRPPSAPAPSLSCLLQAACWMSFGGRRTGRPPWGSQGHRGQLGRGHSEVSLQDHSRVPSRQDRPVWVTSRTPEEHPQGVWSHGRSRAERGTTRPVPSRWGPIHSAGEREHMRGATRAGLPAGAVHVCWGGRATGVGVSLAPSVLPGQEPPRPLDPRLLLSRHRRPQGHNVS